jgi:3-(3-hydroxy-phenyl)propionate hydroxylase
MMKHQHAVVIAGGGPTGMMLAAELTLARVDVAIVERRTSAEIAGFRAGGLHARTLEVLDQRGVADRFISQGQKYPVVSFHMVRLNLGDFPSRHNYTLGLFQNHTERILAGWVDELGVTIYRGHEVSGFSQDDDGVTIELADGQRLRAEYFIGCDGGRSVVRKAAGIDFPGSDPTTSWITADVATTAEPPWGFHNDAAGNSHASAKADDGRVRFVLNEPRLRTERDPTLSDVREALLAAYGTDFGVHSSAWISRFTDMTRQAAAYRERRVLLAGDAAHVHPPMGGQGLNIGVQDAVNLGWKLAQVVRRTSPGRLLDSYHAERHPVGARVLHNSMAQVALRRVDDRSKALSEIFSELLALDEPRKRVAGMMSGLDIHYDFGNGHPLLGRRMPDLDLVTTTGATRVYALLHEARPVLINFGEPGDVDADAAPWADRVPTINARYDGPWELPVLGIVPAPTAVLVRPDGYVAWVGDATLSHAGLLDALTTWFGPSATT